MKFIHKIDPWEFDRRIDILKKHKKLPKVKLGISYNVFDGEELLESSIKSVRNVASYIVVVYQTVSNYHNQSKRSLITRLEQLKKNGIIDELYLYTPDFELKDPHINEKNKRDIGLKLCKKADCDYFLSMDVDEFYIENQLRDALEFVLRENIKCSAVSIIEYLKKPIYQMVNGYTFSPSEYKEDYTFYVPFIMKIHKFKKQVHRAHNFPCYVDPTRGLNGNEKFYLFPKHIIAMHHMSTIRENLKSKYDNSNLKNSSNTELLNDLKEQILSYDYEKSIIKVSCFNNIYIRKVPNIFNIKF